MAFTPPATQTQRLSVYSGINQKYARDELNDMTFNLDRAGDRTSIVDGGVTKDYVNDAMNQYTTNDDTFTYYPDGELKSELGECPQI